MLYYLWEYDIHSCISLENNTSSWKHKTVGDCRYFFDAWKLQYLKYKNLFS